MKSSIILVDFSKVISPIGISRHLAKTLAPYLTLDQEKIRNMYKEHIGDLVRGKYLIQNFIIRIEPYLHPSATIQDLKKAVETLPPLDQKFLNTIKLLKESHQLILVSDIYPELGKKLKKKLNPYFDRFIFSFEEKYKKSEKAFWKQINKQINLKQASHFIDDKEENLKLAEEYGITGILYSPDITPQALLQKILPSYETIILGAGASSIHYGNLLLNENKKFLILEKEPQAGGLMSSYQIGNCYYDLGGHALHNNKKIINFLEKNGIESDHQKRKAYIDYQNRRIPFPFQLHLRYLPPEEKQKCLYSLLECFFKKEKKANKNLDSYLLSQFGIHIYNSFLKPYNQKLRKTKLTHIAVNRKNRIPYENIETILQGYFTANEDNFGTNDTVYYPKEGGFQSYIQPFFQNIKKHIRYQNKIHKIDQKNKLLYTNQGIFHYHKLISTIPLNQLLNLLSIKKYDNLFEFLSLQITAILTKKTKTDLQRIYSKEKEDYFHKLAINSNSSIAMKEKNETLFQFETSFKKSKKHSKNALIKNYSNYLLKKNFIKNPEDILAVEYKSIEYAYPIQTINFLKKKKTIITLLGKQDIFPLGRFGAREYLNYDQVIEKVFSLYQRIENENYSF